MRGPLTCLLALAGGVYLLTRGDMQRPPVFTAAQAASGRIEIEKNSFGACTDCHTTALTERTGDSRELPPLASLSEDYQKLIKGNGGPRTTSALIKEFDDRFRSLTVDTRLNLIAYILQRNAAQPGPRPLTAETDISIASLLPGRW
jgi:hypothetical protein